MEGDAGPQVAVYDAFGYGDHGFHQYQFLPGRGCEGIFGAKQGSASGRFSFDNSCPPQREHDKVLGSTDFDSRGWEGFTFMTSHDVRKFKNHEGTGSGKVKLFDLRLDSTSDVTSDSHLASDLRIAEQKRKQSQLNSSSPPQQVNSMNGDDSFDEDGESLSLKLCSGPYALTEDTGNGARNAKRFRSSSPGVAQSPICQVDDCEVDLKHAKDYHRRHKVCEMHSKAPHSLVHGVLQRFCQQCSRFHPLPQFDEGKRSCRRRLAGHNKRRRKPHPDLMSAGVPLSDAVKGSELLNLFAILSQFQAAKAKEKFDVASKDQDAIQALKRSSSFLPSHAAVGGDGRSAAFPSQAVPGVQRPDQQASAQTGLSPEALLLVFKNILGAQASATQTKVQTQQSSQPLPRNDDHSIHSLFSLGTQAKQARASGRAVEDPNVQNSVSFGLPYKGVGSNGTSSRAGWPSKPSVTKQYFVPMASNVTEASPPDNLDTRCPAERKLFPTESDHGFRKGAGFGREGSNAELPIRVDDFENVMPRPGMQISEHPSRPPSDSSESGSDQSPSSSGSDRQAPSGRICFKLFDENAVRQFPYKMGLQIQEWLSCAPRDVETYMRPGCVLLTVFVRMPSRAWEELVMDLRGSLRRLVQQSSSSLWTKGRILVQVEHQRALILDGKVKKVKFSRQENGPFLKSVRPLAVIAGQESTLVVKGHNLVPQTKILCVYHGKYVLHEVSVSENENIAALSGSGKCVEHVQKIHFPGGPDNVIGRCFVEVEHDLFGNILPVIVADSAVCAEIRSLERELDSVCHWKSSESDGTLSDDSCTDSESEAFKFLNELGWVFQKSSQSITSSLETSPFELSRFKALLEFAVLHDWCAVVKILLDLLFNTCAKELDGSFDEVMHVLSEVNLLHQAVKRKCRLMVELLLQYIPNCLESTRQNIFTPVMKGPAGFTPLHVAASISDAEGVIDVLTNDPSEVGLHGWKNACDFSGRTPEWHALNSRNIMYAELIEKKLAAKQSPHMNITVMDMPQSSAVSLKDNTLMIELPVTSRTPVSDSAQACKNCRAGLRIRSHRPTGMMYRPMLMTIVAIATICASVALYIKSSPYLQSIVYSLKWERIMFGPS